jgi:hypothetical protein
MSPIHSNRGSQIRAILNVEMKHMEKTLSQMRTYNIRYPQRVDELIQILNLERLSTGAWTITSL